MMVPDRVSSNAARPQSDHLSLADALDRILHRGVSLQGNLTIGLADVDLLFLDLRVLLGSVDAIWPEGRPEVAPIQPRVSSSSPPSLRPSAPLLSEASPAAQAAAGSVIAFCPPGPAKRAPDPKGCDAPERGSSTAQGLVRLVLTLVKLLHDVLERQAVRRMDAGRLTDTQIEDLGTALAAQAAEILSLQRQFGFSEKDLCLDLGVPDGAL